MSWLATCPSGSTRIVLARAEIDYVGYQIKRPIAHPISIINLSWSIQSASVYTFNVTAWLVVDKTNSVSPCASPAGLFSFEADIASGRLISVSPGRLDHYSLINFIEQAQKTYPHRSRSFLEALATQNSSEAAFEFANVIWTSLGGIWSQVANLPLETKDIKFVKETNIKEDFTSAFERSFKRLYRDVETANRQETRDQLKQTAPAPVVRRALALSKTPEERQIFVSNTENLFRSVLLRCVELPHSCPTAAKPKKHKPSKKGLDLENDEDIDNGSGGFIRVAQLLSQLAPEIIHITDASYQIDAEGTLAPGKAIGPTMTKVTSTSHAHFVVAGQMASVAHRSMYSASFVWGNRTDYDAEVLLAQEFLSTDVPLKNDEFTREWSVSTSDTTDLERMARLSAVYALWKSPSMSGITRAEISKLMEFHLRRVPTADEVNDYFKKLDLNHSDSLEWKEVETWAQTAANDDLKPWLEMRFQVEHLDGKVWSPKLLILDIPSATAFLYSRKALEKLGYALPRSDMKKMLKGSFDFKNLRHAVPGPVPSSFKFGISAQDNSFVFKFTDTDYEIISKLTESLRTVGGIGMSNADNMLSHALNAVEVALPAIVSIGELYS